MAHFSFTSFFQISLLLILICWTKETTGAAFSLEEEFKQFKIQMNEIVKNLESEVTELKTKDVQMREKTTNLENKVTELEDKIAQQDSLLFDLLQEKNERTAAAANGSAVAINELPSSCADLKEIGHIWPGIYSVMGSAMMESVYCDFNKISSDPDLQKWIGYVDVKSTPVHFYVQRNSNFNTIGTPIPFELARVNEGNAMNLQTGKFTAPRPGIYFFSFTVHVLFPRSSSTLIYFGVQLYLNGGTIGTSRMEEGNPRDVIDANIDQWCPLTLQSTLNLKKGDQVWVGIYEQDNKAYLVDNGGDHYNHFTGFMLQEEIAASL